MHPSLPFIGSTTPTPNAMVATNDLRAARAMCHHLCSTASARREPGRNAPYRGDDRPPVGKTPALDDIGRARRQQRLLRLEASSSPRVEPRPHLVVRHPLVERLQRHLAETGRGVDPALREHRQPVRRSSRAQRQPEQSQHTKPLHKLFAAQPSLPQSSSQRARPPGHVRSCV